MQVIRRTKYLKILLLYIFYNLFIKVFFILCNDLIFAGIPHYVNDDIYLQYKGPSVLRNLGILISLSLIFDLIWLLPYTLMNAYVFYRLIVLSKSESRYVSARMSFTILLLYFIWCMVYLGISGVHYLTSTSQRILFGPCAPYGSFTITYFLLGNFVFLLIFVPLWNKYLGSWIKK